MINIKLKFEQVRDILDQLVTGDNNKAFDLDLPKGKIRELRVKEIFEDSKVEVKADTKTCFTSNLFVELGSWGKPGGLTVTEADWWAFVLRENANDDVVIFIKTDRLKKLCQDKPITHGGDLGLSEGILVNIIEACSAKFE